MTTRPRTRLCTCGKIGHRRKRQAKLAADVVARSARPGRYDRGRKGTSLVPYQCSESGLWHLTSQSELPKFVLQRPKPHLTR